MARPLTDAERARVKAYLDAMAEATKDITEYDRDRLNEAYTAVMKTHPVDNTLYKAYVAELIEDSIPDRLDSIDEALNCRLLKPNLPWGLVVYRVSYGDDAAWERILAQIGERIEESLKGYKRQDLLARHQLVVMNDRSQFDGATVDQVRDHFSKWVEYELKLNRLEGHGIPDNGPTRLIDDDLFDAGQRYNLCLFVDDSCLESLDRMSSPVVKIVNRRWEPYDPDSHGEQLEYGEEYNPSWEGGVTKSEFESVGWMYMEVECYVEFVNSLYGDDWVDCYVRPPLMQYIEEFERAPGFWRRSVS